MEIRTGYERRIRGSLGLSATGFARCSALLSVMGLAVLVVGCGKQDGRVAVNPASGKVTVAGEVPEGALIVLHAPKGSPHADLHPSGKVTKDGTFSLTTYDANDGAPVGDYTATIQWNKLIKKGSDFVAGPDAVPKAYGSPDSSPWKIKIAEGKNEIAPTEIK